MRILFIGEIVGRPGIFTLRKILPNLKKEKKIDFVIANSDSASYGFSVRLQHAWSIKNAGVDVMTLGDKAFLKKEMVEHIDQLSYCLRPVNFLDGAPGRGSVVKKVGGENIAVVSIMGQSGFKRHSINSPFSDIERVLKELEGKAQIIIVDFHALASAEKKTMGYFLDGRVSAVLGTHQLVLTADAQILPKGSAYITDAGRTGSSISVVGLEPAASIYKMRTGFMEFSKETAIGLEMQGIMIEVDALGKTKEIEIIKIPCQEVFYEKKGDDSLD